MEAFNLQEKVRPKQQKKEEEEGKLNNQHR